METNKVEIEIQGTDRGQAHSIRKTVDIPAEFVTIAEQLEYLNDEEIYKEIIVEPHFGVDFEAIYDFKIMVPKEIVPQEPVKKVVPRARKMSVISDKPKKQKDKTYLFENNGGVTDALKKWVTAIDKNYIEVNTEVRLYMKSNDLYIFAMLIDPALTTIATSSAFVTNMPFEACILHGKETHASEDMEFTQMDYYSYLIYEAVGFRKNKGMRPLTIYINYHGIDFLRSLKEGRFGQDTISYMKLMLNQSEGFVSFKIYNEYLFVEELKTAKDLRLN